MACGNAPYSIGSSDFCRGLTCLYRTSATVTNLNRSGSVVAASDNPFSLERRDVLVYRRIRRQLYPCNLFKLRRVPCFVSNETR